MSDEKAYKITIFLNGAIALLCIIGLFCIVLFGGVKEATDFEKTKTLFTELGIGFKTKDEDYPNNPINTITCRDGDNKIGGYSCFFTVFNFEDDGKFIDMGAWE